MITRSRPWKAAERRAALDALRESDQRYQALLEHAPDAIVVLDADTGRFDHVNANACRLFGLSRERLLEHGPIELSPPEQADGRPSRAAALEYISAAIRGETPVFEWLHRRADGRVVPCEVQLVRLPWRDRVLIRGSVTDITERLAGRQAIERAAAERELALRTRKLQRVTDAALSTLSLEHLLPELVCRVCDALAVDNAAVLLVDQTGTLELRAAEGVQAGTSVRLAIGEGFAGRVAAQRAPLAIRGEGLEIIINPALRALRSLLGVPLLANDRVIGVLHVGTREERDFTEQDVQLLRLAGDRVALAVEHAALYEHERMIADALQRALLPERLPEIPGIALAARYRPARYVVGGDFYDIFSVDGGAWLAVVGDVCGKGPEAAAVTAFARYTLRADAQHETRPAALLSRLNAAMLRQRCDGPFLTAVVAHLLPADHGGLILTVSAGGHPLPILRDAGGRASEIGTHGTLLGFRADAPLSESVVRLNDGDSVVLYTDGVLDAHAPAQMLAPEDLMVALSGCPDQAPAALLASLERRAGLDGADVETRDDVAILVLRAQTAACPAPTPPSGWSDTWTPCPCGPGGSVLDPADFRVGPTKEGRSCAPDSAPG